MRISVLTYLFKDSFSRTFENLVSTASRVVASIVLSAIGIGISVYTDRQQAAAEKQLIDFGANRFVLEIPAGGNFSYEELAQYGRHLQLHVIPGVGLLDFGDVRPAVFAYDDSQVARLAQVSNHSNILIAQGIQEGIRLPVSVAGRTYDATATKPEGVLRLVRGNAVLLPLSKVSLGGLRTSNVVFFEAASLQMLRQAEGLVRAMIEMEYGAQNRPRITSSLALQERLSQVQRNVLAQKALALVALSIALALIYGALVLQEYRVQEFSAALMRSMGYSSTLLIIQRAVESAVFVAVGLGIVVGGVLLWDATISIPWGYAGVFLASGVLLSMIPLMKAADKEIGLVLP